MLEVDLLTYNRTRDLPGGPSIVLVDTGDTSTVEPYRDENGEVTKGGWIGYALGYMIVAGGVLGCMYYF